MRIFAIIALLIVSASFNAVNAGPSDSDKNPIAQVPSKPQIGVPTTKPMVPPTPAPRSNILHIHHLGLYPPSCGQPLHFRVQIQNLGTWQRFVGQVEVRSEDGSQRVVQNFNQGEIGGVLVRLPFQITSCGAAPQCFRARLLMDPDSPQWDNIEGRVCITSRCTFEVTPTTSREQY